ncbi:MAG: RelA/SpoT domain-containing protein [Solirubrobacterales bacterium]
MADTDVDEALELVGGYRQAHAYPLTLVTMGLRQFVERETENVAVGQRLKRMDRIIQKLVRFPKMRLARMQDVGGCRAVLASPSEVDAVADRTRRNWEVARERDHRERPDATGYRALHFIVARAAPEERPRMIEIQLRTHGQHVWAEEVERVAARTGFALKDGRGPDELLEYYRVAAELIALTEPGQSPVPDAVTAANERFDALRAAVSPYLGRSG